MLTNELTDTNWSEHYIKRGDPKKPTYYIIRRMQETSGLFRRFIISAGYIRYALSNGWFPVIDMQNYPNPYLPPEKFGKENAWEYYFEQPLRIGLEQAYNGENIIVNDGRDTYPYPNYTVPIYENRDDILTEWRMLVKLGLLRIKPALTQDIPALRKKLFDPNDRVLGVFLRGTDYFAKKHKWHPIPPPIEFALSIVIEKMNEWNCNKVFLSTEDKTNVQIFKQILGNLCVTIDREYIDYTPDQMTPLVRINRPNDYFLQGKEYLTEILLLSTCNSFVTARSSGSVGAMLLADKFEHVYAFNLGTYGVIGLD